MNLIVIIVSVACLLLSTLLALFWQRLFKKSNTAKPIYILLAGAFTAVFVMMLYVDYKPSVHGNNTTLFLAFFHSVQVLLLGYDFEGLYEAIYITQTHAPFAYFYLSVLFFLAPIYTFGFVLSFFESITAYIKYLWHRHSDMYILSDLSDEALVLAKSIRAKFPKALIAFMHVNANENDRQHELIDTAKEIKALCFPKPISEAGLRLHSKKSKVAFFAIDTNENANIEYALSLIDCFSARTNTELYVFSTSHEGALLLDSANKGAMKVRRINTVRALAYSMIYQNPITEHITQRNGKKIISTLIVGMGGYGTELTKALLWCGQLPGYDLEINIIDKSEGSEARFQAICPEIMKLNGNDKLGEARYNLTFYNGIDVQSYALTEAVATLKNTSVVYVSLGNDELNIETAIRLRILFERMGLYPVIRAIVYSDIKCKTLQSRSLCNHQGESYDIEIIGNLESRLAYDTIIDENLEKIALKCHLAWANSPEEKENAVRQFNAYEYYRNSSLATAIHEMYRTRENITGDTAAVTEHMRWNAYMRTEGFVYTGSPEKETRNDRAKMHHNLHAFELLHQADIDKDKRVAAKK